MTHDQQGTERLNFFSDGVFAILITILVLELHPPHEPTFHALAALWPSGLSYAVSYLFLAIVWMNHHHLLKYAKRPAIRLVWANFAHLFTVSLVPFATAWLASSGLAGTAVAAYAFVFALVNLTYMALCAETVDRQAGSSVPTEARQFMRRRSLVTLGLFLFAVGAGYLYPVAGMAVIAICLVLYVQPGTARDAIDDAKPSSPPSALP